MYTLLSGLFGRNVPVYPAFSDTHPSSKLLYADFVIHSLRDKTRFLSKLYTFGDIGLKSQMELSFIKILFEIKVVLIEGLFCMETAFCNVTPEQMYKKPCAEAGSS